MKQYIIGIKAYNVKPLIYFEDMSNGDHKNYWDMGFPAIMITDGLQFRNHNYHFDTDTYQTLDYFRMKKVVDMTYQAIIHFKI